MNDSFDSDGLQTLDKETLEAPESRMTDARQVQDYARKLVQNDDKRSKKRALVDGLVGGNPPYKASKLREAGRADAANVNWGIGRAYMESGSGAYYDLFTEAPGYITVKTDHGNAEQQEIWSNILSMEADRILRNDKDWDYNMQLSQWDCVLHGCGPMIFENAYDVLPIAVRCGDLKVPELAKSTTTNWDAATAFRTIYPPELYAYIRNEKAAAAVGWDVEYTKRVIANAMNILQRPGMTYDWEFYQQELKNNSLTYQDDENKVCSIVHVFWREFNGRITHAIVERETTVTTDGELGKRSEKDTQVQFLYRKIGRYKNWQECIHPMYYDRGDGGKHHSVTGLGVKMYSAMEYENRIVCNLCDKAAAPKILFKPTTTEQAQKFQMAVMGDYAVVPAGFDIEQGAVAGLMNDGLAMHQTLNQILQSNLSSYRQQVPMRERGNPATKYEKQLEASQQSALNKTQFNRYYQQLDHLYAEIYRRLSNLNTTDSRAKEFQSRCEQQGVPREAIAKTSLIQATRVVGQGSSFMRKQAIDSLFAIVGSLPEDGRTNLIDDKIAAEAGQAAVLRYNPKRAQALPTDQEAEAAQWIGLMKVGVTPLITSSQNPVVYATAFMAAAVQAIQSLQQGANPMEVLAFLNICGPAIAAHLKRFAMDPTRQTEFKKLSEQWQMLAKLTDDLNKQMQKAQQQARQQQEATQQVMSEAQLAQAKTANDIQLKNVKTAAQLKQQAEKHNLKLAQGIQNLSLNDAKAASQIMIEQAKAEAQKGMEEVATE